MRIYAFTDLHGDSRALRAVQRAVKENEPDAVVMTGDLTIFEHELSPLLSRLHLLKKPVLIVHGNHESAERMRRACARFPRLRFIHKEFLQLGGYTFIGFGGGGFEERYPELEALQKRKSWRLLDWSKVIFLSHAPPFGTALDDVGGKGEEWHVGSKTLRKLIEKRQPLLVLAGHIHDCFGASDLIGATRCENPGPEGKLYDLDALARSR